MHLLVDGQALQSDSRGRGVGRYAANLLQAVVAARPDWRLTLIEAKHLPAIDREPLPATIEYLTLPLPVLPPAVRVNRWFNDRAYADWLTAQAGDVYLSLHTFEKLGVHPLGGTRSRPHVAVLYDLIPQRFEEIYLNETPFRDFYSDRLQQTRECDHLLAISDWTRRDFLELQPTGPATVTTIGGAPDPHLRPLSPARLAEVEASVRVRLHLAGEFILNPSGQCWRKNSRGAFLAFIALPAELRRGLDYVVACKINRAEEEEIRRLADEHGLRDSVRFTGYLQDDELRALYQCCRVCIFPSFYEGIGLPIVEALQCGAPVVTTDCSSLPEFAGPHSFLADPLLPGAVTTALTKALRQPRDLFQRERVEFAGTFTWDAIAERTARALEAVRSTRARPRLAWFSDALPGTSGMERLETCLLALRERFTVEVVVPEGHVGLRLGMQCLAPQLHLSQYRERARMLPYAHHVYSCESVASGARWAEWAADAPGLLIDDSPDGIPGRRRDGNGFRARAVFDARQWARLKPMVEEPLYFVDAPHRLADALASIGWVDR